jgi:predicted O-methyltransferase YrrM
VKDSDEPILRPRQAAYLDKLTPARPSDLRSMEVYGAEHGVPISDPEVGRLLKLLVRAVGANRVLEIGTAIGYGTLWLARGGSKVRVTTIERDAKILSVARSFLARAGVEDRVELHEGEALEILPRLRPPFDLVYLDGDKEGYLRCLDAALQLLRVGGLVVIDNLLWKGWVADPPEEEDKATGALRAFNGYLMNHPQLSAIVLPLADGLGLAVKKRPLVTDLGGPF